MIRFTRIDGEHRGAKHVVKKIPILLGRAPDADLRLNPHHDLDASARHAEIYVHERGLYLRDLGSRNGTYLNGRRLGAPGRLRSGDEIELGYGGPRFRVTVEIDDLKTEASTDAESSVDEMAATIAFQPEDGPSPEGDDVDRAPDEEGIETVIMDGELRDALLDAAQRADEAVELDLPSQKVSRNEAAETLFVDAIKEREEVVKLEKENRRLRVKTIVLSLFLAISIIVSWLFFSR